MTNEEAKRILQSIKFMLDLKDYSDEVEEALDMAIKALEQQPCEDAVGRKDVHDMLENLPVTVEDKWFNWLQKACMRLAELPPVTPQPKTGHWIPVSERLPEEDGFYLATCDGEICGEDEPFSGLAEFENGKWTDDEEGYQCVLAWQPLPQPYKAESEDKE